MKKILGNSLTFGFLIIAGLLVLRMVIGPGVAEVPTVFAGSDDLDSAIARAKAENKVVFAVATASWCGPCQSYKGGTLADADVQAWIENNAIGVLIDTDANPEDAARLQVRSIPATFVIDPTRGEPGTVLDGFRGAVSKKDLLAALEPYSLGSSPD